LRYSWSVYSWKLQHARRSGRELLDLGVGLGLAVWSWAALRLQRSQRADLPPVWRVPEEPAAGYRSSRDVICELRELERTGQWRRLDALRSRYIDYAHGGWGRVEWDLHEPEDWARRAMALELPLTMEVARSHRIRCCAGVPTELFHEVCDAMGWLECCDDD